jgi:hypothetical protein
MTPKGRATWFAVVVAIVAVVGVSAVAAALWSSIGDSEMGAAGWIAMTIGVLATLALGIGLMALVFISSRHGYDERSGHGR